MTRHYMQTLFSPAVKAAQTHNGSREMFAALDDAPDAADVLGPNEAAFIGARDSFYMATVSETGWPYVQHRGGPAGFVRVLDEKTFAFPDFGGNRQYVSVGNLSADERAAFFFMDYPQRARLKVLGHVRLLDRAEAGDLGDALALPGYRARIERVALVRVEAFDWNCSQHIAPRFTPAEIEPAVSALKTRIAELEAKLAGG